jgi:hypothetical protein
LTGTIFDGFQVVAFANSLPLRHTRRLLSYVIIVLLYFPSDLFGAIHWCWILLIELTVWPILLTLKISVKSGVWATDVKSLQICDCGETGREFLLGCSRLTASAKAWFCLYASARNPLSVNFSFIYPCGQRKWTSISFKFW